MASRESIKVVCRVRPLNEIERQGNFQNCVEHDLTSISINVSGIQDLIKFFSVKQMQKAEMRLDSTPLLSIEYSVKVALSRTFLKRWLYQRSTVC